MGSVSVCILSRRALPRFHAVLRLSTHSPAMTSPSLDQHFVPPEAVRGSKVLDRAAFLREFQLPAVRLAQAKLCSTFLRRLAHARLKFSAIKTVLDEPNEDGQGVSKVLLLAPPHLMKRALSQEDHDWIAANGGEEVTRVISVGYDNFSKHTILRAIFPPEVQAVPSGYEQVGHIAHYNLREEHLPYKHIIGQVTLDKQPCLKTVVNKVDQIDTTFRFFKMEVLAGEHDFIATVKENGCTFTFDFSCVYWNSRLHPEHSKMVEMLGRREVVLDVFAGVGPFAIPAARNKGCLVHANDLNPHSFKYLQANASKNHVSSTVKAYNLDGREFLLSVTKKLVEDVMTKLAAGQDELNSGGKVEVYSHVIMNLPASAVEFLDVFRGLFNCVPVQSRKLINLPLIHCYCFVKAETEAEQERAVLDMVSKHLGVEELEHCLVELVRDVAPNKIMMRASFRLPEQVAYVSSAEVQSAKGGGAECDEVSAEPAPKRTKLE